MGIMVNGAHVLEYTEVIALLYQLHGVQVYCVYCLLASIRGWHSYLDMRNITAPSTDLSTSLATVAALGTASEKNETVGGLHEVEAEVHLSQQVGCYETGVQIVVASVMVRSLSVLAIQ